MPIRQVYQMKQAVQTQVQQVHILVQPRFKPIDVINLIG
jgi:hypothetical protein